MVNFLMVALGFLSVVSGFHLMGADSWEPIRVASGLSNLPIEHFARSELEREFWELSAIMGVSEPIICASGASSLPMEHFARSELERDDWEAPGVGASLPIRTASGASSLPIEHFARSELERDVCEAGAVVASFLYFWSSPKEGLDWSFFRVNFLRVAVLGFLWRGMGSKGH